MKRVGIFRSELLPISETFIRDQANSLRDWQPIFLGFKETPGGLDTPGIQRRLVPRTGSLRFWLSQPNPQLMENLKDLQVHLVHAHFGIDATYVWPSVRAKGLPMLVTLHGYDINIRREWWEAGNGGLRLRAYPRRLLRMARDPNVAFVAVSDAIKQRAVQYGIPESKISVVHVGVDTQRFAPGGLPFTQRRRRILFVGRMVEKKAPLLMIRAFSLVRRQIADAELAMIGDGTLLREAMRLSNELATPVEFLGARSPDEVLMQLHKARVLCLPSVTATNGDAEGFGLAILEAQACGVPVVTSAVGGAYEGLLDRKTGFAFNEGDIATLVAGLKNLLMDDTEAMRVSVAAAQFVKDTFDIRICTQKLELAYDKLVNSRKNS